LQQQGVSLSKVWLDPSHPRDATFVLGLEALVWNESEGFVLGEYVSGVPGVRTVLRDPVRLAGGVLPDPRPVPALLSDPAGGRPPPRRTRAAAHDGFADRIAGFRRGWGAARVVRVNGGGCGWSPVGAQKFCQRCPKWGRMSGRASAVGFHAARDLSCAVLSRA